MLVTIRVLQTVKDLLKHKSFEQLFIMENLSYQYIVSCIASIYRSIFQDITSLKLYSILCVCVYQNVNKPIFNLWIISIITMDTL